MYTCTCVLTGYDWKFLDPNRKINFIEAFFLYLQPGHLVVYLAFLINLYFDLDAPYWLLEDIGPDPMYRGTASIISLLLLRAFLFIPAFLETIRSLFIGGFGLLFMIVYIKEIIDVFTREINATRDFFNYYNQFHIISNVLSEGVTHAIFLGVSIAYTLFILAFWMVICGWGELEITIYIFFCIFAMTAAVAVAVFLPLVGLTGEQICELPRLKRHHIRTAFCTRKSFGNRVLTKKAASLRPIKFSYGSYYPLGKNFSRNVFGNGIENLLSLVLIYDFHGRRYNSK